MIIGFMGSGKTTVARALALRLGHPFVDLDELILENLGRRPAEIIEQNGENEFRTIETQTLQEVLNRDAALVLALGGGAWTIAENRKWIAEHGAFSVWLNVPFELCWRRIEQEGKSRPLAPSREAAEKLYFKRQPVYELAEARIDIAELDSAEEIALRIISQYSLVSTTWVFHDD